MKNVVLFVLASCLLVVSAPAYAIDGCVETPEVPGCNGCPCEACVCELDEWCCENEWDSLCVGECIEDCGGEFCLENCGNGTCDDDGLEDCGTCPADCGCADGEVCQWGECCAPDCEGKECGYDSCGGSCGTCPEGAICNLEDLCEVCTPDCAGMECGGDGCGGDCGECAEGLFCTAGLCVEGGTCEGLCGEGLAGDCYCDEVCAEYGDCCEDVCDWCPELAQCSGCTPDCVDKLCNDDNGCGVACGCEETMQCCEDGTCAVDCGGCVPNCTAKACGPDGCDGSCGECQAGTNCVNGVCTIANGCEDVCVKDEKGCDGNIAWLCVMGASGCTVRTEMICGGVEVCELGACVPGDPGEDPNEDPEPADPGGGDDGGGGTCAMGSIPGSIMPLLALLLMLLPVLRVRRRKE